MGDVVEFRPKRLSGFIPADLGEPLPRSYTIIPVPGLTVDDIFPPWPDTACSEMNPDDPA